MKDTKILVAVGVLVVVGAVALAVVMQQGSQLPAQVGMPDLGDGLGGPADPGNGDGGGAADPGDGGAGDPEGEEEASACGPATGSRTGSKSGDVPPDACEPPDPTSGTAGGDYIDHPVAGCAITIPEANAVAKANAQAVLSMEDSCEFGTARDDAESKYSCGNEDCENVITCNERSTPCPFPQGRGSNRRAVGIRWKRSS